MHTVNFELLREDQPSLSVEMRGSQLRGIPPRNGDRVAIPATPDQHGRYQIDRFQRLSDPRELVVMQPAVHPAAVRRLSRAAEAASHGGRALAYLNIAWIAIIVIVTLIAVLVAVFVVIPNERQRIQEFDRYMEQGDPEAEQRRLEAEQEGEQRQREAEQRQQRLEQQWQEHLDRARAACLQMGRSEADCNRLHPPGGS